MCSDCSATTKHTEKQLFIDKTNMTECNVFTPFISTERSPVMVDGKEGGGGSMGCVVIIYDILVALHP